MSALFFDRTVETDPISGPERSVRYAESAGLIDNVPSRESMLRVVKCRQVVDRPAHANRGLEQTPHFELYAEFTQAKPE